MLHTGGSIVLIGASTHHALEMRHYLRGRFGREQLEKTYAKVVSVAYLFTFALGALLYPSYRVHVRGYYLDRFAPAFSGLFDVKETYASLTLVVALALGALAFTLRPAETPRPRPRLRGDELHRLRGGLVQRDRRHPGRLGAGVG